MPIAALIPIIVQNLPLIISLGKEGVAFVMKVREIAKQTNQWTPEVESAFVDSLVQDALEPQWQPDAKPLP